MRADLFLVIGLIVNTFFAVMYPTQIFGTDPLGLSNQQSSEMNNYLNVNGSGIIQYQNGQIVQNSNMFNDLKGAVGSTDGDKGLIIGELFSFADWLGTAFKLLKAAFMFVIGFIWLLWNLVFPLNFLIGVPFSILYLYGMASFIAGR